MAKTKNTKSKKPARKTSAKRNVPRKIWRIAWHTVLILFLCTWAVTLVYKWVFPPVTPLMVTRFFQQLTQKDRKVHFERDYVRLAAIAPDLVNAVVASEDGNFLHHHGFDVYQLKQSYLENRQGHRVRGGSTISMQTAKNAFLPHRRSMLRKATEAYFTQLIEWLWGKQRIMEVYLNIIEFGDGVYGCEAAAQHYFGHSAAQLSKREAAQLAATLPSPLKRNPGHASPYFNKQTTVIQQRAAKYGNVRLDKAREVRERDRKAGTHDETLLDFLKWMRQQKRAEKAVDDK